MSNENQRDKTIQHEEILKRHDGILTDHEKRVRWLEKVAFYGLGALMLVKVLWDIFKAKA